ncbi:MAG: DUF1028 domain-containing protein [Phycisphaerae bacterium]|nr:DUF1028 domain-containing protein [Gemmatimonadaceae bacterium]
MRAPSTRTTFALCALVALCASGPAITAQPTASAQPADTLDMTTWSVVGVDPVTGEVGVAMASCVANTLADALAALVPGKGAAATQASFDVVNRDKVYNALKAGMSADDIIRRVSDSTGDARLGSRQYGVVTMRDGRAQTAGFTGKPMLDGAAAPNPQRWAGVRANASRGVSVQGNTLVSEAVVANALAAYVWEDPTGFNKLSDRLLRALEAGSVAGGDVRCNSDSVRQTAATAMIVVARGTDEPYATEKIGMSDQGTPKAPWLAISTTTSRGGDNPLLDLRRRYDVWRRSVKP